MGELDDAHRGPLQLDIRWPAFLALLALIRDRSDGKIDGGYPRDVLDALDVHTDHRLVDPAATQRREDRDRSKHVHVDLGKQQERERKQRARRLADYSRERGLVGDCLPPQCRGGTARCEADHEQRQK